jgi:hypothetical protein
MTYQTRNSNAANWEEVVTTDVFKFHNTNAASTPIGSATISGAAFDIEKSGSDGTIHVG